MIRRKLSVHVLIMWLIIILFLFFYFFFIYYYYYYYYYFELLRNGFREEIGLPMTDTGRREWL